jgi:hypothetical protein
MSEKDHGEWLVEKRRERKRIVRTALANGGTGHSLNVIRRVVRQNDGS